MQLSGSGLFVSRLCEGVDLANQLRELNTQGKIKDWGDIQSITTTLDNLCRALSGSQVIVYDDCKRLDSNIEARLKYVETLEKWIVQARAIVEPQLAAHSNTEVKAIASKVFDLEQRLGRKGIDVRSVAQTRLSSSSSASDGVESSAFEEGKAQRNDAMEILDDLGSYQETFRRMDEYERSRAEDNALMERLDTKSTNLIQKVKDRLCVIQDDECSAISAPFSRDILAVLISDKMTDMIAEKVQDPVNVMDVFAKLEIDSLTESLLEDVWKQIQPILTVVDAMQPQRRVVDLECPACYRVLGSATAHIRRTVPFAWPIPLDLSSFS